MSESSQPPNEPPTAGSHYQPAIGTVLVIIVLFIGATFLMLRYTSPNVVAPTTSTTAPSSTSTTLKGSTTTTTATKAQVRVQVANGTLTTGLARAYTQQLLTIGWNALPETNGPRVAATVVYYNPGFRSAALEIAREIHVKAKAVQALNGQTPVSGAANDDVIVVLGPDVAIIQG
ncbi:MAG: LytR C-terminal domain-containing protein [Acidimicrobiaceae bacterium]|nr:LytR C-terminal domain-containing protein [Acidimicrobiaceae bacterium]